MSAWLNSIESLNKIYTYAQLFAIVLGVVAGLCALLAFATSIRISNLRSSDEAKLRERLSSAEKANVETGSKLKAALEAQEQLEKRARVAEQKAESASVQAQEANRRTASREATTSGSTTEMLRQYNGQNLDVVMLGDQEAGRLGNQIIGILETSGWRLNKSFAGMMAPPPYGLIISVPDPNNPPAAAKALAAAFGELAGSVQFVPLGLVLGGNNLGLIIGLKPIK